MPIREEVIQALIQKSAQLYGSDPATLNENTRFAEDLGAKSVHIVQFTAMLEDMYEVEVPFMDFRKRKTFGEAGEYIEALLTS